MVVNVGMPLDDVAPGAHGRLLAALLRFERPASIRELAATAGIDGRHAGRIVDQLLVSGVVTGSRAGAARMIAVNRDHLMYEPLAALAATRQRLVSRLRATLEPTDEVAGAWLFGSAARGDGDTGSDIDILAIAAVELDHPRWDEVVSSLSDHVRRWTGNDVQLTEHSRSSFAALLKGRNRLVTEIRRDGIPLVERGAALLRGAT